MENEVIVLKERKHHQGENDKASGNVCSLFFTRQRAQSGDQSSLLVTRHAKIATSRQGPNRRQDHNSKEGTKKN